MTKKRVKVFKPVQSRISSGVNPEFSGEGMEMLMCIQPVSAELKQRMYGQEKVEIRMALADRNAILQCGDGLCVEREDGQCDFQVAQPVEIWGGHLRAFIRRIREKLDDI